jgi:hypothetical protein
MVSIKGERMKAPRSARTEFDIHTEFSYLCLYNDLLENLHQKYGLHPLQNGREERVEEAWDSVRCR